MLRIFSSITSLKHPNDDNLAEKSTMPFFRDALQTKISQSHLTPSQLQYAIFGYLPTWVNHLMSLRNKIVRIFGFNVGMNSVKPGCDELKIGDTAGFLTVIEKSEDEIISYADDKHMTFYLSVRNHNNTVVISSLVNQKTIIGRIYVNAILPFHYIIARIMIHNAIKAKRI